MDSKINLNLSKPLNYAPVEANKQSESKKEVQASEVQLTPRDADQIMNAMGLMGLAFKGQHGLGEIDPKKYLTPERIADIQASMVAFEGGVQKHQAILEEEFGYLPEYSSLSSTDKLEMAAKSFTQEEAA